MTIARQVEDTHKTVLQYQLFEELITEEEDKEGRRIVVHINCKLTTCYRLLRLTQCRSVVHTMGKERIRLLTVP